MEDKNSIMLKYKTIIVSNELNDFPADATTTTTIIIICLLINYRKNDVADANNNRNGLSHTFYTR